MAGAVLAAALAFAPSMLLAQSSSGSVPKDYYRAEFVILERLVDPNSVEEKMSGKQVEPTIPSDKTLWANLQDSGHRSDLKLVPRSELHLNQAATRLERSGNYRVLAATGWYEAFPPDYNGEPLQVAIGDWLAEAGQHAVEGFIEVDRQRFLHVGVSLNHWTINQDAMQPAVIDLPPEEPVESGADETSSIQANQETTVEGFIEMAETPTLAPLELVTWIRETRRMRSEEVHFIDSPTIGVLVFFKRIDAGS